MKSGSSFPRRRESNKHIHRTINNLLDTRLRGYDELTGQQ